MTDDHQPMATTFKTPNASYICNGIVTNTAPGGYYRCVAHPGGAFNMNIAITKMAEKLGMDPLEFRLKNMVTPADKDQVSGLASAMVTIKETIQDAADKIGYASKKHAPGAKTWLTAGNTASPLPATWTATAATRPAAAPSSPSARTAPATSTPVSAA